MHRCLYISRDMFSPVVRKTGSRYGPAQVGRLGGKEDHAP